MTPGPAAQTSGTAQSPFTGADICAEAGFRLAAGTSAPIFDEQVWDFTGVIGLPAQMRSSARRLDFTAITEPRWRLAAKELMVALLAPRHPAVAVLPGAWRTPLHLKTCHLRLAELTRLLNWLAASGVTGLGDVGGEDCQAYLAHRAHIRDEHDQITADRGPATRRRAAQAVTDLINYAELFTADRPRPGLRPFGGASPAAAAETPRRGENATPALDTAVLQPMLAAALYLTGTLGPHISALARQLRSDTPLPRPWRLPAGRLTQTLDCHARTGDPLPLLGDRYIQRRLDAGWHPADPLLTVNLDELARHAGAAQFQAGWLPPLRRLIEDTLTAVGTAKPLARNAETAPAADGETRLPWTLPLHRWEAIDLIGITRTACALTIAAVSGMRSCELMELTTTCARPPERFGPGLVRYRLAGKLVKGQPLGGTGEQWVVIEPVYRAAQLAAALAGDPGHDTPLFGRLAFHSRYRLFRTWVNGPAGQRLGLAAIPGDNVTLRILRRTLAVELAYRPGGVLATKIALKHVSAATSEGYASRPGGAQGALLAEVNAHEQERNLQLVLGEFRNYQNGVMPAGPGASDLTRFFAHVDAAITETGTSQPKVQPGDRDILNLLSKRAGVLHLGVANYCWFTDPSRALCLKLAGTPHADKPLTGICDSARCPQATHHGAHRDVWAQHAQTTKTFLGQLGPARKTEKTRLQADYDRAMRVLNGIDTAAGPAPEA